MAWHRFADRRRPRRRARRAQDGRARRLPVRHAAHPPAAPVGTSPSAEVLADAAVPQELRRRARPAWPRCSSTPFARTRHPGARHLGAGPHYVASMAYPAATVALLDGLTRSPASPSTAPTLRQETVLQRQRLDQLVAGNDEHQAMVAQLERLYDAAEQRDRAQRRRPTSRAASSSCRPATSWPPSRAVPARPGQELTRSLGDATRRRSTVGAMKVDGGIGNQSQQGRRAGGKELEAAGYSGGVDGGDQPRPVLPAAARRRAHRPTLELGTSIAVAFARNPMTLANIGVGPADLLQGPLHPRPRQPDQAAHHQALLHGVEPPGAAHAGDGAGDPGHLGQLAERHASSSSAASSTRTR